MFRSLSRYHVVAWLGVWLLVACGRSVPVVTTAPPAAGRQTVQQSGVSLALPPEWEVLAAEDSSFPGAMDELVRENPRLETVAEQARTVVASGQVKLLAFDLAPEDALPNFTTNLSIGHQQMEQSVSLRAALTANEGQLRENGFGEVQSATRNINGVDVGRLSSTLPIQDAAGDPLPLAFEQFIVLTPGQQHILTFTTPVDQRERMLPVFEQIVSTFQVL